ncbi:MAG TPA: proline--tRNA ligase [Hadesarchaea archaeon]|nr:proline--tRNA ligase [Hadesarchaea archaeon]
MHTGERMKRERWKSGFSEWFDETLWNAKIVETRYPVKGLYVWLPYGLKLRNRVLAIMRELLEKRGHEEMLFPLLIPENLFKKEAEHIRGFEEQVYWVTHGGKDRLDVKLALRPTSETSIYPMFALWIRSHADLPLKVFQVVNIFRYETKMTKPLVRLREVTTFKEAHTAHATPEDAEAQVMAAVEIYKKFFDELGVPYAITKRPPWDTFAGAVYSLAFDTLAPDGRTLQIGTIHNLGQNFAKVYGIKYEREDGSHEHVHQTCYGISERVIAATVMAHGDDLGPCFPPKVAPVQIVVVPIPFKKERNTEEVARKIAEELKATGLRVHFDGRDIRPGRKFYEWERHGIPLRLEIGPKDVNGGQVTTVRRDTGKRFVISLRTLVPDVKKTLEQINEDMRDKAWKSFSENMRELGEIKEIKKAMSTRAGIVRAPWCGKEDCGKELEEKTGGSVLGEELHHKRTGGECPVCSEPAKSSILIAKTY